MGEHAGGAPRESTRRRADRAIFVGVVRLHEDSADSVGAKVLRQGAAGQPLAFEIPTQARPGRIDRAAAAGYAMNACGARGLLELIDFERGAAHRAFAAGFAGSRRHDVLRRSVAPNRPRAADIALPFFTVGRETRARSRRSRRLAEQLISRPRPRAVPSAPA